MCSASTVPLTKKRKKHFLTLSIVIDEYCYGVMRIVEDLNDDIFKDPNHIFNLFANRA